MYELPTEVTIDGESYHIRYKGDYRMIIDIIDVLQASDLTQKEALIGALFIFYEDGIVPPNTEAAINEMMSFINCYEDNIGHNSKIKLVDWQQDSKLIIAGVNRVMGKEIRSEKYCHWFTFIAAYMEIGESQLSYVIGIRNKIARGIKLEKDERTFKNDNPGYFIWNKDKEANGQAKEEILSIWGKE